MLIGSTVWGSLLFLNLLKDVVSGKPIELILLLTSETILMFLQDKKQSKELLCGSMAHIWKAEGKWLTFNFSQLHVMWQTIFFSIKDNIRQNNGKMTWRGKAVTAQTRFADSLPLRERNRCSLFLKHHRVSVTNAFPSSFSSKKNLQGRTTKIRMRKIYIRRKYLSENY